MSKDIDTYVKWVMRETVVDWLAVDAVISLELQSHLNLDEIALLHFKTINQGFLSSLYLRKSSGHK